MECETTSDLMTSGEHELVDRLGHVWNHFLRLGPNDAELREIEGHVNALQRIVLSQAAARAFPKLYRLLSDHDD